MGKGAKRFWLYSLIFLLAIIFIVVAGFAIMYLSPGTSILGFQYVSYAANVNNSYTTSSSPSISGIGAFKIVTDCSNVVVGANSTDGTITVNHSQNISGFVRNDNANLTYNAVIEEHEYFEEDSINNYKTLVVTITEPSGWISCSESIVNVYLPEDIAFEVIYVKSNRGNISYNSTSGEKNISVNNLYMITDDNGNSTITNNQNITNYYLKTTKGTASISGSTINANTLKFESETGKFLFKNSTNNASMTLSNALSIKSTNVTGPTVEINNLLGNLNASLVGGIISVDNIGASGNEKEVSITSSSAQISFNNLYGVLTVLGNGNNISTSVKVSKLVNTSAEDCSITTGSGSITINELDSAISALSTSSGSINVSRISTTSDIYASSFSGSINISYVFSDSYSSGTITNVYTKTGNIDLTNISSLLSVEVLENSPNARLFIIFSAVYHSASDSDNVIKARDRITNIYLKGVANDLICRILSKVDPYFSAGLVSSSRVGEHFDSVLNMNVDDDDYILDNSTYSGYLYEYRVGYSLTTENYGDTANAHGKILVDGSNTVNIFSLGVD